MDIHEELQRYLDFCRYRKEMNHNTLKAYRIDPEQFLVSIGDSYLSKPGIELFITDPHKYKHYKQKTVKIKIASTICI